MHIYCIGDLHLSLNPIIGKPMDEFGEIWKNHPEKLKKLWNETVEEDDIVIIAGDISWALKLEEAICDLNYLHDLPGKKILIKGNHDLWWQSIGKLNELYDDIVFLQNTAIEIGEYIICGTRGWICPGDQDFTSKDLKIYKREALRLETSLKIGEKSGKKIIACTHFPPTNDKAQSSMFTELYEKYNVERVFFGHLHTKSGFKKAFQGFKNGVAYNLVSYDYLEGTLYKIV